MPISVEQINFWKALPCETEVIEFKEAKTQFDNRKLYEYCVAIGNEGGGHLLLGISNKIPRRVVGTSAFRNPPEMAEKIFSAVGFRVDIEEINHPEGRVVAFKIPGRPRGTAFHIEGMYLMRCGESLVPMSPDVLRRIFLEGQPDWLEQPSKTGLTTKEVLESLDTPTFFKLLKLQYPSKSSGVIDRLLSERLLDEEGGGLFTLRRIGGLLLARRLSRFPDLKRKAARVTAYNGPSKLDAKLADEIAERGYAVGFQRIVSFVTQHLPMNEVIRDAIREETALAPAVAFRELVANALIHQDLAIPGASVDIEIFSNRLEISNPGEPIVPVGRFIDGYQSRNERLGDIMRRLRICEEKGLGIDRVVNIAEVWQLPAPEFRSGQNRTIAVIFGPRPFEQMDKNDRVRACYQHCALKYVMGEKMTNQSLRERFHLAENRSPTVSQIISAATDLELIKPDDTGSAGKKFARYIPGWA